MCLCQNALSFPVNAFHLMLFMLCPIPCIFFYGCWLDAFSPSTQLLPFSCYLLHFWYQVLPVIIYHHCNLVTIIGQPVSMKASDDSSSSLQVPESRNRVPTYHMRELARGKFLLNIDDITLLDCIGEGSSIWLSSSELSSVLTWHSYNL